MSLPPAISPNSAPYATATAPSLLAWRGGALGDFVATFPALEQFRQPFPHLPLHLVTRPAYGPLAVHLGVADSWSSLFSPEYLKLEGNWEEMKAPWPAISRAVAWLPEADCPLAQSLKRLTNAELRSSVFPPDLREPAWKFLLAGQQAPPHFPEGKTPRKTPLLAIHPGSGGKHKNYPLESWEELIQDFLTSKFTQIALILGECEEDGPCAAWAETMATRHPNVILWRGLTLVELATRLAEASLYLGNDSGVGHLAAWLGVPCRILFGPTNAGVWTPYGKDVQAMLAPEGDLRKLVKISPKHLMLKPECLC